MQLVGYNRLLQESTVKALPPARLAEVRAVTRKEIIDQTLAVPASMAPACDDLLGHVLFALKHEGISLDILAQSLPLITEPEIRAAINASPTSQYLRKAGYLWEHFTGMRIQRQTDNLRNAYVPLFDPAQYITVAGAKNNRWRVLFNGIGNLDYCITLRRTDALKALLERELLQQATAFSESLPRDILNRALAWAYLRETRDSYADALYRRIDQEFDIPNSILSRLVMFCLDQNGRLSQNRRKQYQHQVPETVFDALELACREVLDSV